MLGRQSNQYRSPPTIKIFTIESVCYKHMPWMLGWMQEQWIWGLDQHFVSSHHCQCVWSHSRKKKKPFSCDLKFGSNRLKRREIANIEWRLKEIDWTKRKTSESQKILLWYHAKIRHGWYEKIEKKEKKRKGRTREWEEIHITVLLIKCRLL